MAIGGTQYEVWLSTLNGQRLTLIDSFISLSYIKAVNDAGGFTIYLNSAFDTSLLDRDQLISVWRKPVGGEMSLDFRGPITQIGEIEQGSGEYQAVIYGASLNDLLRRRIIAYAAQTAYTDKTDNIDDMMKALVRENLGALATNTNRSSAASGLAVEIDLGLGPNETRAFAWKNLLTALKDLNAISRTDGTEIFFAIEPTTETTYEFRTYKTQPGADLRGRFVFSREFGNLGKASYIRDWSDYANYIYAMGVGDGLSREIVTAYLDPSQPLGFYRREASRDARNDGFSQGVIAAAAAACQEMRPVLHFSGEARSIENSIYGIDWKFGDYVTAQFHGKSFNCIIRAVQVSIDQDGNESVNAMLENYG